MLKSSKSTSLLKQNLLPKKQGAFYQLNLGKNNGPFLSKDIMYNNRKSMTLLTSKTVLKAHQTMATTINNMQQRQNDRKVSSLKEEHVQNFNGLIEYCESELEEILEKSRQLREQEKVLRQQLGQVSLKSSETIGRVYESSMSSLKQFMRRVRATNVSDREGNYQVRRELEKMQLQVELLKKGMTECGNRIEMIEKTFMNEKDKQVQSGKVRGWM